MAIGSTNISLAQDGTIDATFNSSTGANGPIRAIAVHRDGRILIGGTFTSYNGTAVGRIARLNTDGTLDATFNSGTGFPNAADSVLAIAIDGPFEGILVGGRFSTYNGTNITDHIVRLNTSGTVDGSFTAVTLSGSAGAPSTTHVRAIAIQPDDNILIGGDWTSTGGGNPYRRVVRLASTGARDATYNSADAVAGVTSSSWVNSLAVQPDGKIIIAGSFTSYNSVAANRIARLNIDGSRDGTFASGSGAGTNSPIYKVAILPDGDILIAGQFNTLGSPTRSNIARLNSDGSVDAAFNASVSNAITAMCVQPDGKILIGGYFTTVSGQTVNRIARLNSDGTLDTSFSSGTGANSAVRTIGLQTNGKLLIVGNFTDYNGTTRNRIARIVNTATPVTLRNSVAFDGVDDFITVNHHTDFDVSDFTFEAWVKMPSTINVGTYTLFSKEGATIDFRISLKSTIAGRIDHIVFESDVFGDATTEDSYPPGTTFVNGDPGVWRHIAVTVSSGFINYYASGSFTFETVASGTANNSYPLRIGSANGSNFWKGEMDEVRFWNTKLLSPMIQEWQHLELTTTGTGDHDNWHYLKGYWQFNQTETGTLYDYSIWPGLDMNDRSSFTFKNGTPSAGMSPGYIQTPTAPLGSIGTAARLNVNTAGNYTFTNTDCQLNFSGSTIPNAPFVVTHVEHIAAGTLPDNVQIPGLLHRTGDEYWIVDDYSFSSGMNVSVTLTGITGLNNTDTQLYLAERPSNSYGNWATGSTAATGINSTLGQASFGGISSFFHSSVGVNGSQFVPISLGSSTLPIELIDFQAAHQGSAVFLKWQTASEFINDHFIIEHSSAGKEFLPIGRVEGNGTTKTINSYSFTDTKPFPGKNYYRLAQYDLDGKKEYSPIRYINIESQDGPLSIAVYPNPAKDEMKIRSTRFLPKANVVFYDLISGVIVWEKYYDLFAWEQSVDINSIKSGLYRVFVLSEAGQANEKIVVVK